MLTPRTLSPDAGRGADAERKGITEGKGRGGGAILDVEFLILDWMEAELIAQKCGGPTTLLSRFAEELRRAPAAGGAAAGLTG